MCLFQLWFPQGICPVMGLLGYMPSSGIVGSYGRFIPSFFFKRNLHTVLHSGCIILHYHVYFGYQPLLRYMICKISPILQVAFLFCKCSLLLFSLMQFHVLSFGFVTCAVGVISKHSVKMVYFAISLVHSSRDLLIRA